MRAGDRAAAILALLFFTAARGARGAGFFDDVPKKGYVIDDVSLDVLSASGGSGPVARLRYVRLSLDPGRRDIAHDFWPQREMLMVENAAGEKLVFERLMRLTVGADASAWVPRGRVGLEGSALETYGRGVGAGSAGAGDGGPCAALDMLVRAGNVDVALATADLSARTVRLGVAQTVESALSPRARDFVAEMVPILHAARTHGLSAAPLEMLDLLFPGRNFAQAAEALTFRPSTAAPLNPADGAWVSVTSAPEMVSGAPLSSSVGRDVR
jgi:hypothetical protein